MQRQKSTTSLNTISSFGQTFEAKVNDNMNEETQESASQDRKGKMPARSSSPSMAEDGEFSEKVAMKEDGHHQLPPRFSAIFDTKLPTTPTKAFESYPQQPARRSGIYIPKAVFWALLTIFLFETAALFAYTVIGLVNSMPPRLLPSTGASAVVSGCDCHAQPINISPNFFMPQAPQAPVVESSTLSTSPTTSTTSTSSSSSTSSTSTSSQVVGVNASQLADIMKSVGMIKASSSSTHTPTTRVTTITPPGPTIRSTTLLTVDESGSPVKPRPTVTSTKVLDPSEAASLSTRDEPTSVSTDDPKIIITPEVPKIVPITTNPGSGGIVVSVSMSPVEQPTPAPAIDATSTGTSGIVITASLKSHRQLADKPTQQPEAEAEPAPTPSPEESESNDSVSELPEAPAGCTNVWGKSGQLLGQKCT